LPEARDPEAPREIAMRCTDKIVRKQIATITMDVDNDRMRLLGLADKTSQSHVVHGVCFEEVRYFSMNHHWLNCSHEPAALKMIINTPST
jgi:hypothetical protein